MNLVFFGNTEFSDISLKEIIRSRHNILAVVTNPDKKKGRGQKFFQTPVKKTATSNNIRVIEADNLKDENFLSTIKKLNADIYVIVAYRILPEEVFTIPPYNSINLHASYLPYYRGAAPINWVLINGEEFTGVTTFILAKKVDTGKILLREKVKIEPDDTAGDLHDRLAEKGAKLLVKTLNKLEEGTVEPFYQEENDFSKAPKIKKEDCHINWNNDVNDVHNFIRGLSPYPGAYTFYHNKMVKIFKSEVFSTSGSGNGDIEYADNKNGIVVKCEKGKVRLLNLQLEGKKRLDFVDFLNGFDLKTGEKFD